MAGHRHDAALDIGQKFFSAHCSAQRCSKGKNVVIEEEDLVIGS
jgi:hypothetical protein